MQTVIHFVSCDLCGVEVEVKKNYFSTLGGQPDGWCRVGAYEEYDHAFTEAKPKPKPLSIHLEVCPKCYQDKCAPFFDEIVKSRVSIERIPAMVKSFLSTDDE